MNKAIAHILKEQLKDIPIIDKMAGLVMTAEYTDVTYDETGTIPKTYTKRIPISQDIDLGIGEKEDLVPGSSKRGIFYFEDNGVQFQGKQGQYLQWRSRLRMVAWFNTKSLNNVPYEVSAIIVNFIVAKLHDLNTTNQGNFLKLLIGIDSIPKQGKAIFSEYTYDEANTQYLMPPYEYFAIDLTVDFQMHPDCVNAIL